MDPRRVVRDLLRITGLNQTALAEAIGVTQSTVSRWLKGADPTGEHRDKLAAYAVRKGVITTEMSLQRDNVPIVGYVGAGGSVLFAEGQGPFGEAPMPPGGIGEEVVAVVVKGDSMVGQLEDGWSVYYNSRREPPTDDLLGRLCVIGLEDGRILIKKLIRGRKEGCFDLYSVTSPPLLDQKVTWAARVLWIQPK